MDPAAEGMRAQDCLGESACRFKSVARTICRDDYAASSRVCAAALALAKAGINFSSRAPSMSNSTGEIDKFRRVFDGEPELRGSCPNQGSVLCRIGLYGACFDSNSK
jgi:hypothetical protein